ncbi:MAG: apolipoprotein N-acyltransferase [Candidatus Omnitrophota bacterium]
MRKASGTVMILASLLLAGAFLSCKLGFLAFFGFIPFFAVLKGKTIRRVFFLSYFYGVAFFLSSMYWLIYVSPAGWIVLSLYQALYFGLFGVFASKAFLYCKNKTNLVYLIIPSFWVVCEFTRSYLGGGIGWNLLGYSQYKNIPFIQIADTTGVYGISFLIVLINLFIFFLIAEGKEILKKKSFLKICIIPLILITSIFLYGSLKIKFLDKVTLSQKKDIKVSVVQGNIAQHHKWDAAYKERIIDKYEKLTLQVKEEEPDIVIWPETSVPGYVELERWLFDRVIKIAQSIQTYFLIGAPMITERVAPSVETYNSALLFSDKAELIERYNKVHLVPFGEFVPFEKILPQLRRFLPLTGNFISGEKYTVFELEKDKRFYFSVLVCFEDIFPGLVRQFVLRGADFLVNITNDAWFYRSPAAYQHAANSVFRAIENRRPFVRAANTGFSCFIDNVGRIYKWVADSKGEALFVEGVKTSIVSCSKRNVFSFYTRFGDVFALVCIIVVLIAVLFFMIDYRRRYMYNI